MHIGHVYSNTNFFSAWMIFGGRKNNVIFDLILSLFLFKQSLFIVKKSIKMHCPVLFVNYNILFSTIVSRYSYISGEIFSSYKWINGFLTNFKKIIRYNNFNYKLIMKDKYIFRNIDKLNFSKFYGFVFNKRRLPFSIIITSLNKAYFVINEASNLLIPSISIVDSNSFAFNVFIPIPGNDTSFKCVNFYNYFFSKMIIIQKISNILKFKNLKDFDKKKKKNIIFYGLIYNNIKNNIYKIEKKNFLKKSYNYINKFLDSDVLSFWNNKEFFPFINIQIENKKKN